MAGDAEKRLYDATTKGDAATFKDVLQEYPYLLDGASFAYSRNLLHIASIWGQVAIVEEVLRRNPLLAEDLDSKNSSPLHIAAAKGNLQIVSLLLRVAPGMCWSRDCQDMNPIHIAAKNGNVEVLEHLLQLNHFPATDRVYRGETVLHLCVRYGQLRALQVLVEKLGDLVSAQDDDKETLLHCAVRCNQLEMVRYLIESTNIDVLTRNSMGSSPFGILAKMPPNDTTSEIQKILKKATFFSRRGIGPESKVRETIMVVVALIATVAFQAIVTPPGGVWQDNSSTHIAGEAIMASSRPKIYKFFVGFNTAAFVSSLIVIIMLLPTNPLFTPISSIIVASAFSFALLCGAMSYGASVMVILPNPATQALRPLITAYLFVEVFTVIVILLAFYCIKRKRWQ